MYVHDDPDRPRIILAHLENVEAFVVHPAFHLALGLRQFQVQINDNSVTIIQNQNYVSGGDIININFGQVIQGDNSGSVQIQRSPQSDD
jgi:hypothetical protein